MSICVFPYIVHVNAYKRFRLNRWEYVCALA
nr:MAG TPA: hypothetical protein [Caudoviricetes sp.]